MGVGVGVGVGTGVGVGVGVGVDVGVAVSVDGALVKVSGADADATIVPVALRAMAATVTLPVCGAPEYDRTSGATPSVADEIDVAPLTSESLTETMTSESLTSASVVVASGMAILLASRATTETVLLATVPLTKVFGASATCNVATIGLSVKLIGLSTVGVTVAFAEPIASAGPEASALAYERTIKFLFPASIGRLMVQTRPVLVKTHPEYVASDITFPALAFTEMLSEFVADETYAVRRRSLCALVVGIVMLTCAVPCAAVVCVPAAAETGATPVAEPPPPPHAARRDDAATATSALPV